MTKKKTNSNKENQQFKKSEIEQLFNLVKADNGKVIITAGKYKVSAKEFPTFDEAEEYISSKPYELILNTCCVLIETKKEYENNKETAKDA